MFSVQGRLNRKSFIIRMLIALVIYALGSMFVALAHLGGGWELLLIPFMFIGSGLLLVFLLYSCSAIIRRLHDIDFCAWWTILVYVLPICILILCFWPGQPFANRYGLPR